MPRLLAVPSANFIAHGILALVCLAAAWTDLREQVISDFVTIPGMVLGLLVGGLMGGWDGLISAALGGMIGFALFGILTLAGLMSSGDAFLMGAAGALLGYPAAMTAMVLASIFGVPVALVWVVVRGESGMVLRNFSALGKQVFKGRKPSDKVEPTPFPFGIAIALGSLYTASCAYLPFLAAPLP